jgi:outer membrane protein, heavy metal efflux system
MIRRTRWTRAFAGAAALALAGTAASAQTITLTEALRRAEENSPLLRASHASVSAAEARARQAGVSPNPELDIELENALGTGPYSGVGGAELTIAIGQRFERGGKRTARQALARAEVDLANVNLIRTRADVVRDVRNAFADLTAAEQRVTLAADAVTQAEELARTARLLVETGRDPPLRQLRAEASLAEARAAEQRARAESEQAERALPTLIGAFDEELKAAEGGAALLPAQTSAGGPIAVRVAEAERRLAEARIAIERSNGVSDVTARAGVRGYAETGDVAIVGGISLPLAIRDRNLGGVEAAQAELLGAEARLVQARLDTAREVRDARSLLTAAEASLTALEGAGLEQAREAVRVARIGYAAGRFSLLEVLDAQTALNTVLTSIIEARRDRARALAALERAQAQ